MKQIKPNISLKHISQIIDRVHNRYPILSKYQITLIIKGFLDQIQLLLINNDIITIRGLFSDMKIISFNKILNNKFVRMVKVKLNTSEKLK